MNWVNSQNDVSYDSTINIVTVIIIIIIIIIILLSDTELKNLKPVRKHFHSSSK